MNGQTAYKKLVEIAIAITHGEHPLQVDLTCPHCGSAELVYSYTIRELPDEYGFYIICPKCRRGQHFNLSPKPPNFREDLILPEFQRLEDEAMCRGDSSQ
jgi:predicted RNA-binding Zn-ribbon protein involved in translation (DUF1610 family)